MNVLVIGSGGREHALCWAIAKSPLLTKLHCAPGNAGIEAVATCHALNTDDHAAVIALCRAQAIDFVVVGPEGPLVAGLVDRLESAGIGVFGPSAAAARLEGSKGFAKDLCRRHKIPTASYQRFVDAASACSYIDETGAPIVVKADGLAAGKGVTVAMNSDDAKRAVHEIFAGRFGAGGAECVVETYLVGEEASVFVLCDGKDILPLATAQDHKRVFDGDCGPNTGGMGAYSPATVLDDAMMARTMREIIHPTVAAMAELDCPFKGVLFAGLMITETGPQLIEYNVRFGDPECQAIMMRLESDLLGLLLACAQGTLAKTSADWTKDAALTVVMAANGYPADYESGSEIKGLDHIDESSAVVFHAGTGRRNDAIIATGGRVLGVTARGATIAEAQAHAYAAVDKIDWPQGFCRRDIGWRAVERERAAG